MSEMISISREDFERKEERLRKIAREKANILLVVNLIESLNAAQGLDDTIDIVLRTVLEHVGGTNLAIYYRCDEEVHYADLLGEHRRLDAIADPLIREVFETRQFIEKQHDFRDTRMKTPEFTNATTWVFPLVVGTELVGAFKIESMHILARDLQAYLPIFFAHAALILKNEILGYTRLQKAYAQLEQEIVVRRQAEEELREAKAGLEVKVAERTAELHRANHLYDVLSHVNRANTRAVSREGLMSDICCALVKVGQFDLAWVGALDRNRLEITPVAWDGSPAEYVSGLRLSLEDESTIRGPVRRAASEARSVIENSLQEIHGDTFWPRIVVEAGFHSEAAVPILRGGRVEGTIAIYSREKDVFHDREVSLLEEIAADTAKGLDRISAEAERRHAEEEREKLREQLSQAQKMESVGRLAGGVAHDFNNMLSVILGHCQMAMTRLTAADPLLGDLAEIRKAAERSADLTRQLLAFARKQTVVPKILDLNDAVSGMLKMLKRLIGENIELAWRPGIDVGPVRIDPSQIDQILANLCVNARDAISDVGRIAIETANSVLDEEYCATRAGLIPGDYVRLSVSDDGCGMDEETLAHLFEPFFTTKALGKGTGLGLATVYGAVKQNHGHITAFSAPGHGTTLTIFLPRHVAEEQPPRTAEPGSALQHTRARILLVEDEPSLLNMCRMMLGALGHTVLAADTPGEAVHMAESHPGAIDLLMTDVIMPGMNGRDLADRLLALHPGLKCLFMSGYTADVIAYHGVLNESVCFIQKPFTLDALDAKLQESLSAK